LIKDGKVVKKGTYEEIVETGFNIKDILDSFNNAMKTESKDEKKEFTKELVAVSPSKVKEAAVEQEKAASTAVATTAGVEEKKGQDLIVAEEKIDGSIGLKDYRNMFSFSIGSSAMVIYAIISIVCSVLQLAPSYILASWTSLDLEGQQEASHLANLYIASILVYMVMVMMRSLAL